MEHIKDNRVNVDAIESTVHLHWSGIADLDLMALSTENAEYHLFLLPMKVQLSIVHLYNCCLTLLLKNAQGNQEIVRVHAQKMESDACGFFVGISSM